MEQVVNLDEVLRSCSLAEAYEMMTEVMLQTATVREPSNVFVCDHKYRSKTIRQFYK